MENGVLNAADILIHRHPVIVSASIQWSFLVIWTSVTHEIPGRFHKCVHSVHLPPGISLTRGAGGLDEFFESWQGCPTSRRETGIQG